MKIIKQDIKNLLRQCPWDNQNPALQDIIRDVAIEILSPFEYLVVEATLGGLTTVEIAERLYDLRGDRCYDVDREIVVEDLKDALKKKPSLKQEKLIGYVCKMLKLNYKNKNHKAEVDMIISFAKNNREWQHCGELFNMTKQAINLVQQQCAARIAKEIGRA